MSENDKWKLIGEAQAQAKTDKKIKEEADKKVKQEATNRTEEELKRVENERQNKCNKAKEDPDKIEKTLQNGIIYMPNHKQLSSTDFASSVNQLKKIESSSKRITDEQTIFRGQYAKTVQNAKKELDDFIQRDVVENIGNIQTSCNDDDLKEAKAKIQKWIKENNEKITKLQTVLCEKDQKLPICPKK